MVPEPEGRYRVRIINDIVIDGVSIAVVDRVDSETLHIMHVTEHGYIQWDRVNPMVAGEAPTLRLSDNIARALLEALLRHYQGAEDMHTLRADYLHERERVDKLIGMYGDLAEKVDRKSVV